MFVPDQENSLNIYNFPTLDPNPNPTQPNPNPTYSQTRVWLCKPSLFLLSYAKILGETNFQPREIPRSGSKAENGKERKRVKVVNNTAGIRGCSSSVTERWPWRRNAQKSAFFFVKKIKITLKKYFFLEIPSSCAKIWGETNFQSREFPRSRWKDEKERKKKNKKVGENNGQLHFLPQATWTNIIIVIVWSLKEGSTTKKSWAQNVV